MKILDVRETHKSVYLFLEYMDGGDLFGRLEKADHFKLDEEITVKVLFYQIASAVFYLHERKIAHRDIKVSLLTKRRIRDKIQGGIMLALRFLKPLAIKSVT